MESVVVKTTSEDKTVDEVPAIIQPRTLVPINGVWYQVTKVVGRVPNTPIPAMLTLEAKSLTGGAVKRYQRAQAKKVTTAGAFGRKP